jgi:hypothetical protein
MQKKSPLRSALHSRQSTKRVIRGKGFADEELADISLERAASSPQNTEAIA